MRNKEMQLEKGVELPGGQQQEPQLSALIAQLLAQIALPAGRKLVLAYSGGVDSEVLAHGLSQFAGANPEYGYQLVHVHHGLSANADAWAEHCRHRAAGYQLPLVVKRVQVRRGPGLSLEAEARAARYEAIMSEMAAGDVLLTAHHEDDQLETLLLALKRGQGPRGLAAMGEVQVLDGDKLLLRPLLSLSRERIEDYAARHGLSHIEDESNSDTRFDRNFLRLEIIPRLKARWPGIATTASRSAALCAEQQALLEEEVSRRLPLWLAPTRFAPVTLKLAGFDTLSAPWQRQIFRALLAQLRLPVPSQVQLDEILLQLLCARDDARVSLKVSGLRVRRFQGHAYVGQAGEPMPSPAPLSVAPESLTGLMNNPQMLTIALGEHGGRLCVSSESAGPRLRLPGQDERVTIRFGAPGSLRCQPDFRDKGRELKKLWQELAVPPWLRQSWPLVFYGDTLVAAAGLWLEKSALAEGDTPGILLRLQRD
jgi:tRNA(Ile)-lysidine synthase